MLLGCSIGPRVRNGIFAARDRSLKSARRRRQRPNTENRASKKARNSALSRKVSEKGGPDNDWSVCTTWRLGEGCRTNLTHVWRGRVDYPTLKTKVQELANQWNADQVLIEESGTAIGLLQELAYQVSGLTGVRPERNKETRMSIASAKFEAGQVYLPESAPWLAELEAELFSFPGSPHDDQIDSISQALNHDNSLAVWEKL